MDTLAREDLRLLIDYPAGPCVSIFLPTLRAEPELQQNAIRLENLLRQAEARLARRGLSLDTIQELLAPAWRLVEDHPYWEYQSDGLTVFAAPGFFRVYRLPVAFEELAVVGERMHITPLLPLLGCDGQFYVLALSLNGVRLLHGTRSQLSALALPGVPASLKDALKYDEFAKQAQFHPGVPGRGGARGAIFHGQGARDDRAAKEEILSYFQQVNHGVCARLADSHAPLLLAGIAYLLPIYRAANTYPYLIEPSLPGNPDDLRPEELHARAWALAAHQFDQARQAAAERYRALAGNKPALASSYLRAIVPAAYDGRVETLFVESGAQRWGSFDPDTGHLTLHDDAEPRDNELIDYAAIQTLVHSGTVYAVAPGHMPEAKPLAAIFRY